MGNKYRQPPPDYVRRSLSITDRLETLENTPRSTNTSVDQGTWKFVADNGITMVEFGLNAPGLGRGWIFLRGETGIPAFYLGGNQSSGNQFWRLCDNNLNDIITDDAQSGQGLARPYIPYPAIKFSEYISGTVTTASTTFVPAYLVVGKKQHPVIATQYVIVTPAGVSAEVQLVDTTSGNPASQIIIQGPNTFPGSTFTLVNIQGPLEGNHMDDFKVDLQFRVSAGAGTIGITHVFSYGRQS
jgi:hypothetical protein